MTPHRLYATKSPDGRYRIIMDRETQEAEIFCGVSDLPSLIRAGHAIVEVMVVELPIAKLKYIGPLDPPRIEEDQQHGD